MADIDEAKFLICELCKLFYDQGWVSGTGGGMSIKVGDKIVMAPSGVQKERMIPSDMYVLDATGDIVLESPVPRPPPYKPPKLSECSPLFLAAYELRGAGAVLHSHSLNALLATVLDETSSEFRVTHLEMIKGIVGQGYYSNMVVPIIENTARECELTGRLREAIEAYPESNAVLVRRHGVYVWGKDWIQAKTQAECYDYLFEAAVKLRGLGVDASLPPSPAPLSTHGLANGVLANGNAQPPSKKQKVSKKLPSAIVLDIEGTVAPISFVTNVLFPYARAQLRRHLDETFESSETQEDIQLLREQAERDVADGVSRAVIPPPGSEQASIGEAVIAVVAAQMDADRKTTALKALQGHIWRAGFNSGALKGDLFRDVPDALVEWRNKGIKTYIYSSGSREAQKNLFGHTTAGDLRPYLSGFFDTTSGAKMDAASYRNIAATLGVDAPSDILFATDVLGEARAAHEAGWRAVLVVRDGNKSITEKHAFPIITSMEELVNA